MRPFLLQHGSWVIAAAASVAVHGLALVGMTRVVIEPSAGEVGGAMNAARGMGAMRPSGLDARAEEPRRDVAEREPEKMLAAVVPVPEPEVPLALGIERSTYETETWLGFETPTEHSGLKSDLDQAQLAIDTGGGTFASGSPGAPVAQEGSPASASETTPMVNGEPSPSTFPDSSTRSTTPGDAAKLGAITPPAEALAESAERALAAAETTLAAIEPDPAGKTSEFPSPELPTEERAPAAEAIDPTRGRPEGEERGVEAEIEPTPLVVRDPAMDDPNEVTDAGSKRELADPNASEILENRTPEESAALRPAEEALSVPVLEEASAPEFVELAPRAAREAELAAPMPPLIGLPEGVTIEDQPPVAEPMAGPLGPPPPPGRDAVTVAGDSREGSSAEETGREASPAAESPTAPAEVSPPTGSAPTTASAPPTAAGNVNPGAPGEPRPGLSPRAGEADDRESDATARKPLMNVRPGRPAAAQGLKINTIRPRWGITTRILAAPRDPIVKISFDRKGVVRNVEFVNGQDAGSPELNGPLLEAIYRWTARGEALDKLPPDSQRARVTLTMRIVLGGG